MNIYQHKRAYWAGVTAGGLAMLLAGCGPNETDQTPPTGDITTADVTPVRVETPDAVNDDAAPASDDAPASNTTAEDTAASDMTAGGTASFPAKFQGRWAVNTADCAKAKGMETTVMTIKPGAVQFYESTASLTSATVKDDVLTAKLGWTGEGENWDSDTVFTLKDGGAVLTRADADRAEALTYKKCPA